MTSADNQDTPQGLAYAITAYVLWGFLPLYMKLVAHIPADEVVVHRILWSVPIAAGLLIFMGRTQDIRTAFRTPKTLLMGCVTAALISLNWGTYVWSIANDHALDAALGYYINPLFAVLLGALLLGERMVRLQWFAVGLAFMAIIILTIENGRLPIVTLLLTTTWGFYAFFKKWLPVGPNQGFLLEVLILTPPALLWLGWLTYSGENHFLDSWNNTFLLMAAGVVTAVPLLIYSNGAKLLRLSTIGILQYIAPTMIFLTAVLVFGEPFGRAEAMAFPLIWLALVLYSIPMIRQIRKRKG